MAKFSSTSLQRLGTCHPKLQEVLQEAIKEYDFSVICGHRGREDQEEAFSRGASKLHYPESGHNKEPSVAVDCAPYPIDWNDLSRFKEMAGVIKGVAGRLGVDLVWGGEWAKFRDYPHFELKKESLSAPVPDTPPVPPKTEQVPSGGKVQRGVDVTFTQEVVEAARDMAERHGIPVLFVLAIIRVESGGNADVLRYEPGYYAKYVEGRKDLWKPVLSTMATEQMMRSTSWGLMQVMGDVARELGFRGYFGELCDVRVNIEYGCLLIERLWKRFGDWRAVAAAYNGGGGKAYNNPEYVAKVDAALGGDWPE